MARGPSSQRKRGAAQPAGRRASARAGTTKPVATVSTPVPIDEFLGSFKRAVEKVDESSKRGVSFEFGDIEVELKAYPDRETGGVRFPREGGSAEGLSVYRFTMSPKTRGAE